MMLSVIERSSGESNSKLPCLSQYEGGKGLMLNCTGAMSNIFWHVISCHDP